MVGHCENEPSLSFRVVSAVASPLGQCRFCADMTRRSPVWPSVLNWTWLSQGQRWEFREWVELICECVLLLFLLAPVPSLLSEFSWMFPNLVYLFESNCARGFMTCSKPKIDSVKLILEFSLFFFGTFLKDHDLYVFKFSSRAQFWQYYCWRSWIYSTLLSVSLSHSLTHTLSFAFSLFTFSQDGTLILHSIRRGQFLRTLRPVGEIGVAARVTELGVGLEGHIVAQTAVEGRSAGQVWTPRTRSASHTGLLSIQMISQHKGACSKWARLY